MTGFRDGLQGRVRGVKHEHRILSAETTRGVAGRGGDMQTRQKDGLGAPGTGITDAREPPCGFWDPNTGWSPPLWLHFTEHMLPLSSVKRALLWEVPTAIYNTSEMRKIFPDR